MATSDVIRLMLIDDHRSTHEIVKGILLSSGDIKLVAQGSNGEDALYLCDEVRPDVILMDIVMPGIDGVEATKLIHTKHPEVKILALSSFQDDDSVRQMLQSGAVGYVLKGSLMQDLVNTIRATFRGKAVFSPEITQTLLRSPETKNDFGLTDREKEVLRLLASGMNNNEIGDKLVISVSTVKFHITNILVKMQVETRAEAIVLAAKNDLV